MPTQSGDSWESESSTFIYWQALILVKREGSCLCLVESWAFALLAHESTRQSNRVFYVEKPKAAASDIVTDGEPVNYILDAMETMHVSDKPIILACALSKFSTMTDTPNIHIQAIGSSGKGKSVLVKMRKLFPTELRPHLLADISPKALVYAQKSGMKMDGMHMIVSESEALASETLIVLRLLTDTEREETETTEHWTVDPKAEGASKFMRMPITGQQLVWLSSVEPVKDEQLRNRFIYLNVDESLETDKAVLEFQKKRAILMMRDKPLPEFEVIKEMHTILNAVHRTVIIPYIKEIEWPYFDNRRNFPLFVSMVRASAVLHQFQRLSLGPYVVANLQDFQVAKHVWDAVKLQKIDDKAWELFEMLPTERGDAMAINELVQLTGMGNRTIYKKLVYQLHDSGLILVDKNQREHLYWKLERSSPSCSSLCGTDVKPSFNKQSLVEALNNLPSEAQFTVGPPGDSKQQREVALWQYHIRNYKIQPLISSEQIRTVKRPTKPKQETLEVSEERVY